MSSGFISSCYWTDWNWANTENIRIGLVFAALVQWKFLYCIDRFDHIRRLLKNYKYLHNPSPSIRKWLIPKLVLKKQTRFFPTVQCRHRHHLWNSNVVIAIVGLNIAHVEFTTITHVRVSSVPWLEILKIYYFLVLL
jgi:hypothetical protein